MKVWNLVNIAKLYQVEQLPTWSNGHSESTIDYIWMNSNLANKTTTFYTDTVEDHFGTDHQSLNSVINMASLQTQPQNLNKRKKRKIFNITNTTEEEWQTWKTAITLNIKESDLTSYPNQTLNQQWE